MEPIGETEEGSRLVKKALAYLAIAALSFVATAILERLAAGLGGHLLRTEIYSIHGFSHVFSGIGLASTILCLRPRATARTVIFAVLLVGIAWELYEGYWLRGEPIDSVEDVVLAILSATTFLCLMREACLGRTKVSWDRLKPIWERCLAYRDSQDKFICLKSGWQSGEET